MRFQVEEGALVEAAGGTGIDRRAFGEFVGPHGEMASYAFGWTEGTDPPAGRLTVGIGAGNPGGGTFHAVVTAGAAGPRFALVDAPFEQVPEGGPDLTAEDARRHTDLPFVWWVADCVMARDRRAWWMRHWLDGTVCIQSGEVAGLREPVLLVSHDADDGMWQLIGATDGNVRTAAVAHLHHTIGHDPTLLDILDLPRGITACRAAPGEPWTRRSNGATPPRSRVRRVVRRRPPSPA